MITIYGLKSTHVARVRAALLKKGLKFQHVSVNLGKRSEEFSNLTPIGKIPVLKDEDGTIIWESANIMHYLDKQYPDTYKLFPDNPKELAKVLNVIGVMDTVMNLSFPLAVEQFSIAESYQKAGLSHRANIYTDQQKADLKKDFALKLDRLAQLLNGQDYFTGTLSAADIIMVSGLTTLEYLGVDVSKWKKYLETMMKEDCIAQMSALEDEKIVKEI